MAHILSLKHRAYWLFSLLSFSLKWELCKGRSFCLFHLWKQWEILCLSHSSCSELLVIRQMQQALHASLPLSVLLPSAERYTWYIECAQLKCWECWLLKGWLVSWTVQNPPNLISLSSSSKVFWMRPWHFKRQYINSWSTLCCSWWEPGRGRRIMETNPSGPLAAAEKARMKTGELASRGNVL